MTDNPLVTIIVPVYNAERYLPYCVESILGQSYHNLQIILVDDGSTDASADMCDAFAAKDARIDVVHQSNGGIGKAQNAGLDRAEGQYIAFADNDDILDRRNIELLLHALLQTNADMSKARWRQFGVSALDTVQQQAAIGAPEPGTITVFRNPLRAYQTVFCKSLRMIGTALGRKTEARYFNEANWCRLYRRELWDGLRFPEGAYAQDVKVAGELYSRMSSVADLDVVLYNWLQSGDSVTHSERSFGFYHDNVEAGAANFELALNHGVTPMRSYYTLVGSIAEERTAKDMQLDDHPHTLDEDIARSEALIAKLTPFQRMQCSSARVLRLMDKYLYDRIVKNMK